MKQYKVIFFNQSFSSIPETSNPVTFRTTRKAQAPKEYYFVLVCQAHDEKYNVYQIASDIEENAKPLGQFGSVENALLFAGVFAEQHSKFLMDHEIMFNDEKNLKIFTTNLEKKGFDFDVMAKDGENKGELILADFFNQKQAERLLLFLSNFSGFTTVKKNDEKRIVARTTKDNDIIWKFYPHASTGELIKWNGYNEPFWIDNVAPSEAFLIRVDSLGGVWKLNPKEDTATLIFNL